MALKPVKEEKFIVPGWMVSFSDMIVNLMCFFILLNCIAQKQECGFQGAGTGEYVESVLAEGAPGLMPSQRTLIPLEQPQSRYAAPHLKPLAGKEWVEHTLKTLQEDFDRISKSHPERSDPGRKFVIPVEILFSPGSSRLNEKQKQELDFALPSLLAHRSRDLVEIVGACAPNEVGTMRAALELSFARARAVADYLVARGMPPERLVPSGIGDSSFGSADESHGPRQRVELRWMLRP
jgi:outer membrane protein OmpA-like peptidoglycan-associated protein